MNDQEALELLGQAVARHLGPATEDPFDNIHVRSVLIEHEHGALRRPLGWELAWALKADGWKP